MAVSSSSRMFGLTARSASERDSSADSFRRLRYALHQSIHRADFSICASPAEDSVNILLHRVNQLAAGVTVNRVKLTVKGFKFYLRRQVVAVLSSIRTGVGGRKRFELQLLRSLGFSHINQFHQQRTYGNALFFNSEIVLLPVSPERIRSRPLRISGCSQVINCASSRASTASRSGDGDAIFRQAKSGTQHMIGRRQHDHVVAAIV